MRRSWRCCWGGLSWALLGGLLGAASWQREQGRLGAAVARRVAPVVAVQGRLAGDSLKKQSAMPNHQAKA